MPTTANRGYVYPSEDDGVDPPTSIRQLADSVDADMAANLVPLHVRQVKRAASFSLADSNWQGVVSYDLGSTINKGSIAYASGVFTVPVDGLYRWSAAVDWPSSTATHSRYAKVFVNGNDPGTNSRSEGAEAWHFVAGVTEAGAALSAGGDIFLNAGDTVQLWLYQSSGAGMTLNPRVFSIKLEAAA